MARSPAPEKSTSSGAPRSRRSARSTRALPSRPLPPTCRSSGNLIPAWALKILVLGLIVPVLITTIDGFARAQAPPARRRALAGLGSRERAPFRTGRGDHPAGKGDRPDPRNRHPGSGGLGSRAAPRRGHRPARRAARGDRACRWPGCAVLDRARSGGDAERQPRCRGRAADRHVRGGAGAMDRRIRSPPR